MNERISIVTDEISQDLSVVAEFLSEHDLHAVELRCISDCRLPELSAADREVLARWARDGDPALVALSPGLFKCEVDDHAAIRGQLGELLPRSLELACDLGVENLICFGFRAPGRSGFPGHALEALAQAAERCAEVGLPLLVENEPGFLASTAGCTVELLERAGHPNLFANWDPLNGNEFGAADLEVACERLSPWLRNVHVKNGLLPPGELFARCGPLGDGAIDWGGHLRQLQAIGYDGWFAVETHFEPVRENSAEAVAELRAMLASVQYCWDETLGGVVDADSV